MRVHCFSTGVVRPKSGTRGIRRYVSDDWAARTLPVNVFAVEHEAGICLFDTGQTADAVRPGYFPRWFPFFRLSRFELEPDDEAVRQLGRLGIAAERVRWVVLSHLHTDHVGGLAPFASSEVLVSRVEWKHATGVRGKLRGYLPQYWPPGIEPSLIGFEEPGFGPFSSQHDLAGDGRLVLVPTPGHTPGHMSMLVRTGSRSFLLGGDAAKGFEELERSSPEVASFCSHDRVVFLATHDSHAPVLVESEVNA